MTEIVRTVLHLRFNRVLTDMEKRRLKIRLRYAMRILKLEAKIVTLQSRKKRVNGEPELWSHIQPKT